MRQVDLTIWRPLVKNGELIGAIDLFSMTFDGQTGQAWFTCQDQNSNTFKVNYSKLTFNMETDNYEVVGA
jgi:hypothetical protein